MQDGENLFGVKEFEPRNGEKWLVSKKIWGE